ncbi:Alanine--tRNA ligase [Methylobacterium crusticola]|uniref:Alanine--tRNA ligase n=1 Tax=Methylobacterium crusticola TaxID=1697972 RepID=A0ABQ4QXM1_9HYPH|nr:alanyl-tRNA editing protein [Methylobacterium crusticola]GJD50013.1 Alanine--tRNA ligase [Methylobacterium crusticola]
MTTELLFRDDAYLREVGARVVAADETGLRLDRTLFYARGGGQPGDRGTLVREDGRTLAILDASYGPDRAVLHRTEAGAALPAPGEPVRLVLDWPLRYARMRAHTALHLLSVALPYPVTGGAVGDGEGRLDFDIPDAGLDREAVTARLRAMIATDAAVTERWITDAELLADPGLVKTMSVKPPMGSGRVRLVAIAGLDLQPCGGTHVRRTGEIGAALVTAIEKKGRQNRRVRLSLPEAS